MKAILFLLIILTSFGYSKNQKNTFQKKESKSIRSSDTSSMGNTGEFINFLGIDSVATYDNSIDPTSIDSISLVPLSFKANYIGCFKANVELQLYMFLKTADPERFKKISAITTGHGLQINNINYHFNGMPGIGCNFTEKSKVLIKSTVYSFFSHHTPIGKIIILDSIVKAK